MLFHVGPREFRLRIVPGPIQTTEGQSLLGHVDMARREILIGDDVRPGHRLEFLGHELKHAWNMAVPKARTEEEDANFFALVSEAMYADLQCQGGVDALESMRARGEPVTAEPDAPPELTYVSADADFSALRAVQPVESQASAHGGRAQCGVCGCIVAGGSIVTSAVYWSDTYHGRAVDRALFCPHCNHVQKWVEGVGPTGQPNDAVAAGPEYVRGEAVERFLREHPEAVGMVCV